MSLSTSKSEPFRPALQRSILKHQTYTLQHGSVPVSRITFERSITCTAASVVCAFLRCLIVGPSVNIKSCHVDWRIGSFVGAHRRAASRNWRIYAATVAPTPGRITYMHTYIFTYIYMHIYTHGTSERGFAMRANRHCVKSTWRDPGRVILHRYDIDRTINIGSHLYGADSTCRRQPFSLFFFCFLRRLLWTFFVRVRQLTFQPRAS